MLDRYPFYRVSDISDEQKLPIFFPISTAIVRQMVAVSFLIGMDLEDFLGVGRDEWSLEIS